MTARTRVVLSLASTLGLVVLCAIGGATLYFIGGFNNSAAGSADGQPVCEYGSTVTPEGTLPSISPLTNSQVYDAAIIVKVGQDRNVPPRGWIIAIATALQESGLRNLPYLGARNDHDSIGLFQQRPSQGWGTPQQISDPVYASQKFYQRLVKVRGWQNMVLTDAAQAVQRSGYPDAYAKREPLATRIVNTLTDAARQASSLLDIRCRRAQQVAMSGWKVPAIGLGPPARRA